ncbi:MAG: phosphotransacetylase [Endomicrobium sp.]|jgi:phosphate acetyltransferase|nr:phosphotransacetylase [Endomicrobium sp.]
MNIKDNILQLAKQSNGRIIMPESFDIRVLKAAQQLIHNEIGKVIIPINSNKEWNQIKSISFQNNIDLDGIETVYINIDLLEQNEVQKFITKMAKKNIHLNVALDLLQTSLYFSMMYLKSKKCDACICGAVYDTADVLRAGLRVLGVAEGIKKISSYFLMLPPKNHYLVTKPVLFTDCAVNPEPNACTLRDITVATIKSFKKIFPNESVNVSMLSFSTKGSSNSKVLDKIIKATELIKTYFKGTTDINIDGELQFDASVVPVIGKRKAPHSSVAGIANILVFPDLNSGNIGYKIAERYGAFQALGPIIQGFSLPVSDLSRGSNTEDIYLTSAILLIK